MSSTKMVTRVTNPIADFLSRKHPAKTAESVAAETGCTVAAVKKWIYCDGKPSHDCFLKLIAAYGPDILAAVLPPSSWIEKARAEIQQDKLEADLANAERRLAEFNARRGRK